MPDAYQDTVRCAEPFGPAPDDHDSKFTLLLRALTPLILLLLLLRSYCYCYTATHRLRVTFLLTPLLGGLVVQGQGPQGPFYDHDAVRQSARGQNLTTKTWRYTEPPRKKSGKRTSAREKDEKARLQAQATYEALSTPSTAVHRWVLDNVGNVDNVVSDKSNIKTRGSKHTRTHTRQTHTTNTHTHTPLPLLSPSLPPSLSPSLPPSLPPKGVGQKLANDWPALFLSALQEESISSCDWGTETEYFQHLLRSHASVFKGSSGSRGALPQWSSMARNTKNTVQSLIM